jgi:hypothetical protein
VAPADGGEEAVWRDVQERVERTAESVPQHRVARAMPTGVANDQVRLIRSSLAGAAGRSWQAEALAPVPGCDRARIQTRKR